jgi:hypothetical protein
MKPGPKDRPVAFGREAARRIRRAVHRVEGTAAQAGSFRPPQTSAPWMTIQPASVTTAIPTGTLARPSTSGRVTIYRDTGAGGLAAAETGAIVHNYHTLTASIATGTTISVYWRAGFWWLVAADC